MTFFIVFLLLSGTNLPAEDGDQVINVDRIIEKESVQGETPDLSSGACSFAMRVKLLAHGGEVTKADPSRGMLFSVASGWYDGIRASYSWNNHSVSFEIGRVAEKSAVGLQTPNVSPLVLHDFVWTYDGKMMRTWLDGKLAGEKEFVGKIESKGAPLKVGFGSYGIGYSRMFVDQLEYYPRALTEREVAARFEKHPADEKKMLELMAGFQPVFGTINLNNKLSTLDELIKRLGKESEISGDLIRQYWQQLALSGDFAKAVPMIETEVDALSTEPVPPKENVALTNQWVSRLFSAATALRSVPKTDEASQTAAKLLDKLSAKYPDEFRLLDKISILEDQMLQRSRDLEAEAIRQFQETVRPIDRPDVSLFLAPDGSDENAGTAASPLASLNAAFEKASEPARAGKSVVISVQPGRYRVTASAALKYDKLSDQQGKIIVQAVGGGRPVFDGKVVLKGFAKITDQAVLDRLDPAVREKVLVCDLKANGITDFGAVTARGYGVTDKMNPWTDLYVGGTAQTLARWPNDGEELLPFGEVVLGPNAVTEGRGRRTDADTFRYDYGRVDRWRISDDPDENDIWMNGLFQWEWAGNTRKVKKIDREKKLITVDYKNISGRFHYYFRNVFEELDVPGEFYIDRTNGLLYLYPPEGTDPNVTPTEFTLFSAPFVQLENVAKCVFQGITFSGSRETAFWATGCQNCYLDDCVVEEMGVHAVIMNASRFCGVFNSVLRKLGGCGVRFSGGDRATLAPSGLTVHNCEIGTFCQVDRAYAAAVQTNGCGMVATNNLVHDSPHHGFRMDGNDQYVARNEVHSVVYEFSDQSGIDIYCDPMYRGIVIEKNLWHHIGSSLALCGQAGIRLDDSISGVVMKENVFYRSSGGMFGGIQIHGGKDNLCVGNLFVDCKKAFSFSPWGNDRYLREFIHGAYGTNVENYLKRGVYPFVDEDLEKNINRNFIFKNEAINCESFQSNGNIWDLFVENIWKSVDSAPTADGSIPTPKQLREWLEKISGRSMAEIGLSGKLEKIEHAVSPNFSDSK